eukprot:SAG22_NODE_15976_length_335_cov_1.305085_1_plen_47_part_10
MAQDFKPQLQPNLTQAALDNVISNGLTRGRLASPRTGRAAAKHHVPR